MSEVKKQTLNIDGVDVNGDKKLDNTTFIATTTNGKTQVQVFADYGRDGSLDVNQSFYIVGETSDIRRIIYLYDSKVVSFTFANNKMLTYNLTDLLNEKNPTPTEDAYVQELLTGLRASSSLNSSLSNATRSGATQTENVYQRTGIDREVAENGRLLGRLRDSSSLDSSLSNPGISEPMQNGIGGLIGAKGTPMGSGGLVARSGGDFDTIRGANGSLVIGALEPSLVDAVIKRNMTSIRAIYQNALKEHPSLAGGVVIKFVIQADGTVSQASVKSHSFNNTDVGNKVAGEIAQLFLKLQFPQPKGGGNVIVPSYPLVFNPGEIVSH